MMTADLSADEALTRAGRLLHEANERNRHLLLRNADLSAENVRLRRELDEARATDRPVKDEAGIAMQSETRGLG